MRLYGILVPLKRSLSFHSVSKHGIALAHGTCELIWINAVLNSCSRAAFSTLPDRDSSGTDPTKRKPATRKASPSLPEAKPGRASSKASSTAEDQTTSSASKASKRELRKSKPQARVDVESLEVADIKVSSSIKPSPALVNSAESSSNKPYPAQSNPSESYGYEPCAQINPAERHDHKPSPTQVNVGESSASSSDPKRSGGAASSKAEASGEVNIADDVKVPANTASATMVSVKKAHNHAKVKAEVSPTISQTEAKAEPRVRSLRSQVEARAAIGESEVIEAKPAEPPPMSQARSLRSQAEEKAAVGAVGIAEASATFEDRQTSEQALANESPVLPEVSTALEGRDVSNQAIADESKKASYVIAFPVKVFSEWWISCFMKNTKPFTDLTYPLSKIHVWVAAYQRVHLNLTGNYVDSQTITGLIKQLLVLQYMVVKGRFEWADTKHIYLPSPVVDAEEKSSPLLKMPKSPTFQDSVVQEVLLLILEPIFEARFSARSHGFRPGRDANTALRAVRRSFPGCFWFISGNTNILHEEVYATHVVDCVLRVVRDRRVVFLLKSGLLGGVEVEQEGVDKVHLISNWGSCSRLRHFLCNVVLDQLDWWMDEQILSLSNREQPSFRCSSSLLFKPATVTAERPRRLEYVRYGAEFLVACNGSQEEAQVVKNNLCAFLKQKFRMDTSRQLTIGHISTGVKFLDHIISQKVVHPIVSRRMASNGRVFEKRALGIRLSLKASRQCCLMHLKEIGSLTSLPHIKEMLSILNNWYYYAENREKVMEFCKFNLCFAYAKGSFEKHKKGSKDGDFAKHFQEVMQMVVDDRIAGSDSDRVNPNGKDKLWIPEHEKLLRNLAWLQNRLMVTQSTDGFKKMRKLSPQQHMTQVVRQFLRGFYPFKGDNCWEPEIQMQTSSWAQGNMADLKNEELAQSSG